MIAMDTPNNLIPAAGHTEHPRVSQSHVNVAQRGSPNTWTEVVVPSMCLPLGWSCGSGLRQEVKEQMLDRIPSIISQQDPSQKGRRGESR